MKKLPKEKIYKHQNTEDNMIIPGDPKGLPDDSLKVVVFIDNAYLIRLKNYFFKEKFSYSVKDFIESFAKKQGFEVEKIYLYDAPPFQSSNPDKKENIMKENYDRFISDFIKQGIVVREGRTQRIKAGKEFIYSQKGVDMLLGLDMAGLPKEHPQINKVILLSGDSDFVPAVEKVKSFGIKVILWTYFDRNRKSPFSRSNYLLKSASEYFKINKEDFIFELKSMEKKK